MTRILTIVLGALVDRHVSVSVCRCLSQINYSVRIPWKDMLEDKCLNMSVFTLGYTFFSFFFTKGGVVLVYTAVRSTSSIVVCKGSLSTKSLFSFVALNRCPSLPFLCALVSEVFV